MKYDSSWTSRVQAAQQKAQQTKNEHASQWRSHMSENELNILREDRNRLSKRRTQRQEKAKYTKCVRQRSYVIVARNPETNLYACYNADTRTWSVDYATVWRSPRYRVDYNTPAFERFEKIATTVINSTKKAWGEQAKDYEFFLARVNSKSCPLEFFFNATLGKDGKDGKQNINMALKGTQPHVFHVPFRVK